MASVSRRMKVNNMESLFEETIIDLLRHNPISGWNENKEWPLKQNLKS